MAFSIGDALSIGTGGWASDLGLPTGFSVGTAGWIYGGESEEYLGEPIEIILNQPKEIFVGRARINMPIKNRISFVVK